MTIHRAARAPGAMTGERAGSAASAAASTRSALLLGAILVILLLGALALGTLLGAVRIPMSALPSAMSTPIADWGPEETILLQVRIPRVLTAALVGAGLAMAGVAMQTALRNPLAEPYLLGISSGASFGAVCVILSGLAVALPFAAFAGGLLALTATLVLGRMRGDAQATRVILAGVAVTALFSAFTSLTIFQSRDSDSYRQVLHWLLGSLSSVTWESAGVASGSLLIFGGALVIVARLLDILLLGDEEIHSLGLDVRRVRAGVLIAASLLAAGMVSVSGAIGFVGLIVPHIVRSILRLSQRSLLVLSAIAGALLLVLADTFSRTVVAPQELPVGITTSILGAVVFAVIMLRKREVGA
ncbi:FecCD family ABC transporter permease [Leucobacter luti]|uniref:Iron complex transport system permease protein n=1 Tax=Leucobacter luti TaxID=340320 RepID=A0A4Q7U0U1_9MICO|nr:iron chelate uptake ABC transporter family permease subunit [Leucobacter luti]RZT66994.1 iron complex transport system permease protein [Leucobacter luti]